MKYSSHTRTRSEVLRQALRDHGPWYAAQVSFKTILILTRRRLVKLVRYVQWASMSVSPAEAFLFQEGEYRYFRHPYNSTWRNERAVEVPIVRRAIDNAPDARVLEVGNVLGHYAPYDHDVVDKYERGPGVLNVDILELQAAQPYDLIVSVSTLEHIGWDDDDRDPAKIPRTVRHLRALLAPNGRAIITVPFDYNPHLDAMLRAGTVGFDREYWLQRTGLTEWCEVTKDGVAPTTYGERFPGASCLVVGIIESTA